VTAEVVTIRNKVAEKQAVRLDGSNADEVREWIISGMTETGTRGSVYLASGDNEGGVILPTLEGTMTAQVGDWVVKGVQGEFYPVKDSVFQKSYDIVG
jgi:hypothetical protein